MDQKDKDLFEMLGLVIQRQDMAKTREDRRVEPTDGFFKTLFLLFLPIAIGILTTWMYNVNSTVNLHWEEYLKNLIKIEKTEQTVMRNTVIIENMNKDVDDLKIKRTIDDRETVMVNSRILKVEDRLDKNDKLYLRDVGKDRRVER